jgi:hypothetical protein
MKRLLIVLTISIVFVLAFTLGSGLVLARTSPFLKGFSLAVPTSISANNQGHEVVDSPFCPCHELETATLFSAL